MQPHRSCQSDVSGGPNTPGCVCVCVCKVGADVCVCVFGCVLVCVCVVACLSVGMCMSVQECERVCVRLRTVSVCSRRMVCWSAHSQPPTVTSPPQLLITMRRNHLSVFRAASERLSLDLRYTFPCKYSITRQVNEWSFLKVCLYGAVPVWLSSNT